VSFLTKAIPGQRRREVPRDVLQQILGGLRNQSPRATGPAPARKASECLLCLLWHSEQVVKQGPGRTVKDPEGRAQEGERVQCAHCTPFSSRANSSKGVWDPTGVEAYHVLLGTLPAAQAPSSLSLTHLEGRV